MLRFSDGAGKLVSEIGEDLFSIIWAASHLSPHSALDVKSVCRDDPTNQYLSVDKAVFFYVRYFTVK